MSGFNRIGGTTRAVSSTTSPISPGSVVVVEVVVEVSVEGSDVSDPPPHAEAIRKITVNKINVFLFFI